MTWFDDVYLSTNNAVLDGADAQVGSFFQNRSLPAGGRYTQTNTVTLPSVLPPVYHLILKTDAYNALFEANEANNTTEWLDSDEDGMSDALERVAGTDPYAPGSVLEALPPQTGSPAGVQVCWRSVTNRLYTLERSTNLSALPRFVTLQPGIPGQTNITCFTDPTATNRVPYFYRVGVEP